MEDLIKLTASCLVTLASQYFRLQLRNRVSTSLPTNTLTDKNFWDSPLLMASTL